MAYNEWNGYRMGMLLDEIMTEVIIKQLLFDLCDASFNMHSDSQNTQDFSFVQSMKQLCHFSNCVTASDNNFVKNDGVRCNQRQKTHQNYSTFMHILLISSLCKSHRLAHPILGFTFGFIQIYKCHIDILHSFFWYLHKIHVCTPSIGGHS